MRFHLLQQNQALHYYWTKCTNWNLNTKKKRSCQQQKSLWIQRSSCSMKETLHRFPDERDENVDVDGTRKMMMVTVT